MFQLDWGSVAGAIMTAGTAVAEEWQSGGVLTCTTPAQRLLVCYFPPARVPDSLRSGTLPHSRGSFWR